MTVRIQVVIEADTMEAAVARVRAWLAAQDAKPVRTREPDGDRREREVRQVVGALKGPASRTDVPIPALFAVVLGSGASAPSGLLQESTIYVEVTTTD